MTPASKVALITGSSSVIGRALSLMLARQGYHVVAQYHTNEAAAQSVQQQIVDLGVQAKIFRGDLRNENTAWQMVEETVQSFGRLDVLVNAIGPFVHRDILETTPQEWLEDIDTNLNSVFFTSFHAREHLVRSRGQIVNFAFAGVEHLRSREHGGGYCAAKTALVVLTRTLATRLARFGVRVNAVCPGFIDDAVASFPEDERRSVLQALPLGRMGRVDEVVDVVRWLLVESPDYLTGILLPVAGAWEY